MSAVNNLILSISDYELESLNYSIKTRFGISLDMYSPDKLKLGVVSIINKYNLGSLIGFWNRIIRDRDFLYLCIDEIAYFLIEEGKTNCFSDLINEEIIDYFKSKSELKLWIPGCGAGYQIYALNLILKKYNLFNKTEIIATDKNSNFLSKAIIGKYSVSFLNKFCPDFLNKENNEFYSIEKDQLTVKEDLKNNVYFNCSNLITDKMDEKFDLVCCKNVFIFFDEVIASNVISNIHQSINTNGFLIIGNTDYLPSQFNQLFKPTNSVNIFQKK